ncbi:MAG: glycerol-3-phosphate 1-O-acyltransferase PlsY [Dehalococcoidia bacterium]
MWWLYPLIAAGGYLLGSIPFGLIVGRRVRGVDIRDYGSGVTGFTNSLRTLGLGPSLIVFAGDLLKGALPVLLAGAVSSHASLQVVAAVAAVVGHCWPLYAGFRGGKGVTTSFGATAAMMPPVAVFLLLFGAALVYVYRYVSLVSVVATPTGGLLVLALIVAGRVPPAYGVWAVIAVSLVLFMHRGNIQRLRSGTERKLGEGGGRRTRPGSANP